MACSTIPTRAFIVATMGTITEVRIHETGEKAGASDAVSYDVSVKVGDTIYVVLYTPALREVAVKYAAGRSGLVLVGKSTIRYNDLLGRSFDLPIESLKAATGPKEPEALLEQINHASRQFERNVFYKSCPNLTSISHH
jgi:hypothetical protein